jgi:hypothetical protein
MLKLPIASFNIKDIYNIFIEKIIK